MEKEEYNDEKYCFQAMAVVVSAEILFFGVAYMILKYWPVIDETVRRLL